MPTPYCVVDAFTDKPFGGVPVAVFTDSSSISPSNYSKIAGEMQAGDTVFIKGQENQRFEFLYYNSAGPANYGAHSCIAGVQALLDGGKVSTDRSQPAIIIVNNKNEVEAYIDESTEKQQILLKLKVKALVDSYVPNNREIADIIGLTEADISNAKYRPLICSNGTPYLFVPIKSYNAIREASFSRSAWSSSSLTASLVDKMFLFAPNTDGKGADFHSRILDGSGQLGSDPAIGEAVPAFAAYLCKQEHVQQGTHSFTVRRGPNEGRQSHLHVEMDNQGEPEISIRIGGSAVMSTRAELLA